MKNAISPGPGDGVLPLKSCSAVGEKGRGLNAGNSTGRVPSPGGARGGKTASGPEG